MALHAGDEFSIASSAEEAVDRLAELHTRATTALNQALKRYVSDRAEPDAACSSSSA